MYEGNSFLYLEIISTTLNNIVYLCIIYYNRYLQNVYINDICTSLCIIPIYMKNGRVNIFLAKS